MILLYISEKFKKKNRKNRAILSYTIMVYIKIVKNTMTPTYFSENQLRIV